jgi:ParB family transcriptional regulator, chromosome partitioning protein
MIETLVSVHDLQVSELCVAGNIRGQVLDQSIKALADSMKLAGLLQPILVRTTKDGYDVVDGMRRLTAAMSLGWKDIKAIVLDPATSDSQTLQQQLICNLHHEKLPARVVGKAIFDLMDACNCSARDAAAMIGMSSSYAKLMAIMKLPAAILEAVDTGAIPASCGYELSRIDDVAMQAELAAQVLEGKLTRDGLQKLIKNLSEPASPKPRTAVRKSTITLGSNRHVTVSAPGLDMNGLIECLDELLRSAKQSRKKGIELNTFAKMLLDFSKKEAT